MNFRRLVPLTEMVDIYDYLREPVSQTERNNRSGKYPYYGATGQVGWIDDYRQDGTFVLLGEDGAPFLDPLKPKAYMVKGKCWVNNHAHVLKGKDGICDDEFLCLALNFIDYSKAVTGSTRLKLPQNMMNKLLIPNVKIDDQRRIATELNAQLAEVEKTRKAVEVQFEEMNLLYSRHREVSLNELKDAPRVPLGDLLINIEAGKSFKTTELPARPDELGVLKVSAVSWNKFQPQEAKSVPVDYEPDEKHRVQAGDLLISRANTVDLVGAVVRTSQAYPLRLLSDKTLRLVFNEDKVKPDYLLNVLRWPEARTYIENNATGTSDSMRNISQKTIRSIPVPLIPKKMQSQIVRKFGAIGNELGKIEIAVKKTLSELELLPQKLLSQAFEMN